jgi:hypothetical protein
VANVRNANTFYIDTQSAVDADNLIIKGLAVHYVSVTATAANGRLVLQDLTVTPATKVDLRVATSGDTEVFSFEMNPLLFPNGIKPSTLSNAVATVVYKEGNR